jgi:DNA-binding NarL/FixJ family response regulator
VVDDYEAWRRHVRSLLHTDGRWRIVGEASDGPEAVEKARALEPDLILLDVGLPTLTGIEAARRIVALQPGARIVFLSEHRSWDVVEAALGTRARGYIVKSDVGSDLPTALQAIADGKRFISSSALETALRRTQGPFSQTARSHELAFHVDETSVVDHYARFAGSALEAGHAVILVASQSRQHEIRRRLQARGLDTERAIGEGRYLELDAAALLSSFMIDGVIDEAQFLSAATALIMKAGSAATGTPPRVAACGDGASTLWSAGKVDEALRLEQLWDQLACTYNIDVFCGYMAPGSRHDEDDVFQRICAAHSAIHRR